jgi:hypothetical protein
LTREHLETAEQEVQDTSCWGSGGVPHLNKIPQDWGIRGFNETILAVSIQSYHHVYSEGFSY